MGLDWVAKSRTDDETGETILPQQTLGMRKLSREDDVTMVAFRAIHQSHQKAAMADHASQKYKDFWLRPFDDVVTELLSVPEDTPYIQGTGERIDVPSGGSFAVPNSISWRGKRLNYCGLPEELVEPAYGEGEEPTISPEQALLYANDLEEYLRSVRANPLFSPDTGQEEQRAISEAIAYLRFWGSHGHPIFCWY